MTTSFVRLAALFAIVASPVNAQQPQGAGTATQTPTQGQGAGRGGPMRPRPYNQVVTDRAVSDEGGIMVHKVAAVLRSEVGPTRAQVPNSEL